MSVRCLSQAKKCAFIDYFVFLNFIYLFLFLTALFLTALCGLSLAAGRESYSWLSCVGFLMQWLLLLWSTGF